MEKFAATSKNIRNKTTTIFASDLLNYVLRKIMINWNNLIFFLSTYIQSITFWNQFPKTVRSVFNLAPNVRIFSNTGVGVGLSKTDVVGGVFSLSSSSWSTLEFSADLPIPKSSNAVWKKGVSFSGLKIACTSN